MATRRSTSRALRALTLNVAVLTAAFVLALAAGEVIVRTVAPQNLPSLARDIQPRGFYAPHPRLGFTMNPGFQCRFRSREFDTRVRFNSMGLRDRERSDPAGAAPPRRILVIGDSYTFGWGVEEGERYVDRFEELLRSSRGPDWDVVKAGTNAYDTGRELAWLREYGWGLRPELVVLQFCMGNDFTGADEPEYRVEDGLLVPATRAPAAPRPGSPVAWLKAQARKRSHLYVLLRDRTKRLFSGAGPSDRREAEIRKFHRTVDDGLPETREALAGFASDARGRGVPLVLLIVPMRHQIYDAAGLDAALLEHPNRALAGIAGELGIPVLDLLGTFRLRAAESRPRLYFRGDPHWTREGHRVAGQALFDYLHGAGFLGRQRPGPLSTERNTPS
jgi:lysophospholipase L1-like esterase